MVSPDTCSVSVRRSGSVAIVTLAGEVDTASVPLLARALRDACRTGKKKIVLDARGLTYIDSSGIQTLLSFQRRLQEKQKTLAVVGCHGVFRKLMTLARLERHIPVFTSLEEAFTAP